MEAVQGACALLDEILPPLREQPHRGGVLLLVHTTQPLALLSGQGDVEGIQPVVLSLVADAEHPDAGGELGGYVHHLLAEGDEMPSKQVAHPVRALHRPATIGETLRPAHQRPQTGPAGAEARMLEQVSPFIDRREGVDRLVRVDTDQHFFHAP